MGKNVDLLSTYSLESFFWQRINVQIFLLLLLLRSLSLYIYSLILNSDTEITIHVVVLPSTTETGKLL
jgi:hypothetical protein